MKSVLIFCLLLLAKVSFAADQFNLGGTIASPLLQRDTWAQIVFADEISEPKCKSARKPIDAELVVAPPQGVRTTKDGVLLSGGWTERWYLDRCGIRASYIVKFTADGRGGTFMQVTIAPKRK